MRTTNSYRRNRGKKLSYFKPGHTYFPRRPAVQATVLQHTDTSAGTSEQNTEWDRPSLDEYCDAVCMSTEDVILPTKLRPAKPVKSRT